MRTHDVRLPWGHQPPAWVLVAVFWLACATLLSFFLLPAPWCWPALIAIIPVIHGAHDVLHGGWLPARGRLTIARRAHQRLAELVGFALQGMNILLLRPSHVYHHSHGRDDEGFSPDMRATYGRHATLRYYVTMCGGGALFWQLAGFARLLAPRGRPARLALHLDVPVTAAYLVNQLGVGVFFAFAAVSGGALRLAVFELAFCFVWSFSQNVAHYGLRGIDAATDRVCARTYLLPWPLNWLTFGSTAHFLHHADMRIPGRELYDRTHLQVNEERLGILIVERYGLRHYIVDALRQFRGVLDDDQHTTSWLLSPANERPAGDIVRP